MSFRLAFIALSVCALSGCAANNLATLKELKPVAGDFDSSLATEYLAFADSESEQGRADAANHFAEKGIKAFHKETVLPDMPGDSLSPVAKQDLGEARQVLLALLTADVKQSKPQASARSQLLYDCWLSQQGRDVMPCGDEFRTAMDEIQQTNDIIVNGSETKYSLQFAEHSSAIDVAAQAIINKVAKRVKNISAYAIELESHEMGDDATPDAIAIERLAAVRDAFSQRGIPVDKIKEKDTSMGKAVLLGNDIEEANAVDVTLRTHPAPGGQ